MDPIKELEDLLVPDNKLIEAAKKVLNEYGITKLALWSNDFWECYEEQCAYNEEDQALLGTLRPEFYLDLDQGGNEDECAGRVVAVELVEDQLNLILVDDWEADVFRVPADEVADDPDDYNINFQEVMKAIAISIKYNMENDIPKEKWGVCHHPEVDPYTYEYVG